MGFGVVLLFAAGIILVLAIRGTYKQLKPWSTLSITSPLEEQQNIQTALTLAKNLQPF